MGSVWLAEHLTLNTQVAVKFMSAQLAENPDAAARFSREATAAAQIKSPHVVQTFDHGLFEGRIPFIVMEFLEGESLSSYMKRNGPLSPRATSQIITQMCKALSKAHARNVIHRDIKPDNVFLVDSDGEIFVKVLDFGIAKQMQQNTHVTSTGAVMGTPHYMSPEQMMSSKHVDPRSDLWAVGVVAYQCLTGTVPFDGETFAAIAVAIASGQFPPPFAHRGIGSPDLDTWFAHALARDPNQRFASAREMAMAFASVASSGSMRPPQIGDAPGGTSTSPSWGETNPPRGHFAQTAPPKTFTGVTATGGPGGSGARASGTKKAAIGLAIAGTLAAGSIGALVTFSGGDPNDAPTPSVEPGAAAVSSVEAAPSAVAPPPQVSIQPELAPPPPVEPAASAASTGPAAPAAVRPPPRPRPARTTAPKQSAPQQPKTSIPDRGF
jgi:serine/threonine-protein kinase